MDEHDELSTSDSARAAAPTSAMAASSPEPDATESPVVPVSRDPAESAVESPESWGERLCVDPQSGTASTHEPHPPPFGRGEYRVDLGSPQQRKALVALSLIPGLGTQRIRTLLAYLRSPVGVWKATRSQLENVPMIGTKTIDKILTFEGHDIVARQIRAAEEVGARVVTPWDEAFPEALRHIYDPPAFFWMRGEVVPVDTRAIAIVGTRRCTDYGKQQAYRLARELVQHDITIVSGLAYGVDGAAHRGALDAGGRTIAVLGSGLRNVYPAKHKPITDAIAEGQGAVLSEYSLWAEGEAGHFPERNRIVSGIALGTVVVQSHAEGGSLITAQMALDQNREVFAVPGQINVSASAGANALIQNGAAKLVTCVQDILDELRLPEGDHLTREAAVEHVTDSLEGDAKALYEILTDTPIHLDVLCAQTGLPPSDALVALLQLEFDGHIRQLAGKQFRRI